MFGCLVDVTFFQCLLYVKIFTDIFLTKLSFHDHMSYDSKLKFYRYKEFGIPLDVGERSVLKTTSDGNCIFNAISIALYGDEAMALPLKLGSVLSAAENIVSLTKYVRLHFIHLLFA